MQRHPDETVQRTGEVAGAYLRKIAGLFKEGSLVTLLVRTPAAPDGSRDFILTSDTIEEAIKALQTRQSAPTLTGDVVVGG